MVVSCPAGLYTAAHWLQSDCKPVCSVTASLFAVLLQSRLQWLCNLRAVVLQPVCSDAATSVQSLCSQCAMTLLPVFFSVRTSSHDGRRTGLFSSEYPFCSPKKAVM